VLAERTRSFLTAGISPDANTETQRLLRFHRLAVLVFLWVAPMFAALALVHGVHSLSLLMLGTVVVYIVALVLTLRGHHTLSKVVYNYGVIAVVAVSHVLIGGTNSIPLWFFSTTVYAGAVYASSENGAKYMSMALSLLLFLGFSLNSALRGGFSAIALPTDVDLPWILRLSDLTALSVTAIIIVFLAESVRNAESKLEREHAKSERLLHNILPQAIVKRLKKRPDVIADGHDAVTVLFCDIVGFTPLSETLSPHELVEMLDELFSRFDALTKRHGLEKIKTIGDAYMLAGGLPLACDDHAIRVARMALDMQEEAKGFEKFGTTLGLRIGFHSGAVVAGVIGRSKFAYDLWGDTVNTASRMESEGVVGKIQVSDATRSLLEDEFEFAPRGSIAIKGKGDMQTHFLLGPQRKTKET